MSDLVFQRWIASKSGRIQTTKSILGRSCKKKRFHVLLATPVGVNAVINNYSKFQIRYNYKHKPINLQKKQIHRSSGKWFFFTTNIDIVLIDFCILWDHTFRFQKL